MWYEIPKDAEAQQRFLDSFFAEDEAEARKTMEELLEIISAPQSEFEVEKQLNGLYEKMQQVYEGTERVLGADFEDLFSGKHTKESFFNDMERLCCYLANHELFDSIDNNALNEENTLTLIQLGDALKNEKNFSEEQVLAIEKGLSELQHRCDDEYYQKTMGSYDPAKEIEKIISNEKEAVKFSRQLASGELHVADYVKDRLELLQNFVKSNEKTLDAFLSPAAPEKQQKKIVDINAWTEEEVDAALNKHKEEAAKKKVYAIHAQDNETPGKENAAEAAKKEAPENVYGAAEAALKEAEKQLQSRKEMISQQKQQVINKVNKSLDSFARYTHFTFDDEEGYKRALGKNETIIYNLEHSAKKHSDSPLFGDDFRQKLNAYRDKMNQLVVEAHKEDFPNFVRGQFNDQVQKIEQETAKAEQKLQEAMQALQDGLKNTKEQAEILKLQDALKAELSSYDKALLAAKEEWEDAQADLQINLQDQELQNNVKRKVYLRQMQNEDQLKENYQEMLDFKAEIKMAYDAGFNREEIKTVFDGIRDTKPGRRTMGFRQKDDTLFKNMKSALTDYMQSQDQDVQNAEKAYEACRIYLASRMNPDKTLKNGTKDENIRAQGVVRILELMEALPEFQDFVEKEPAKQEEVKAPEGWEIMDPNAGAGYNKLNFEQLENSLAKNSSDKHDSKKYAGSKAFASLNKQIKKKKAEEKAAQEKAAAKAAKENAKKAKKAKAK